MSHAILTHNRGRSSGLADGILLTPSHNPPEDGGIKYNPPTGGPADTAITQWIERAANEMLEHALRDVRRMPYARARQSFCIQAGDFSRRYVEDLAAAIDLEAVRSSGITIGIDPLGGAAAPLWAMVVERYRLAATITNAAIDPTFRFVPADWDGRIRMDCSSPHAMAGLLALGDRYDIAFANDTDADRHAIVTRSSGLLNPNHYLAAAIAYLAKHRPDWRHDWAIGKTIVSSAIIDRIAADYGHRLVEVPVGFKWFVDGLLSGTMGFAGEESAGASLLRRDGAVWTTDKDGIVLGLLAAEITARTGRDPGELYGSVTADLGRPVYERIDVAATPAQKRTLRDAAVDTLQLHQLAGERVTSIETRAPGNGQPIGGVKVSAASGWFAARPSGTEDVYKIYAESFRSSEHLRQIQHEARAVIDRMFARG